MSKIRFPEDMPKAPSVADADKMMLADASTNEAKHITFDQAKQYFTIEGQRIAPVSPGALPVGPSGQTRYMEVTEVGSWTYGGNTFTNSDGYKTTLWWNGTTWSNAGSAKIKGDPGNMLATEYTGTSADAGLIYPTIRAYQGKLYRVKSGETTLAGDLPTGEKYELIGGDVDKDYIDPNSNYFLDRDKVDPIPVLINLVPANELVFNYVLTKTNTAVAPPTSPLYNFCSKRNIDLPEGSKTIKWKGIRRISTVPTGNTTSILFTKADGTVINYFPIEQIQGDYTLIEEIIVDVPYEAKRVSIYSLGYKDGTNPCEVTVTELRGGESDIEGAWVDFIRNSADSDSMQHDIDYIKGIKTMLTPDNIEQGGFNVTTGEKLPSSGGTYPNYVRSKVRFEIPIGVKINIQVKDTLLVSSLRYNIDGGAFITNRPNATNSIVLEGGYSYNIVIRRPDVTAINPSDVTDDNSYYITRYDNIGSSNVDVNDIVRESILKARQITNEPNLIAHRLLYNVGVCPENCIDAVRLSALAGFKIAEIDVQVTSDNEFVILHDDTINRTLENADGTAISGAVNVSSKTLAQLRSEYRIKSSTPKYRKPIPTLDEMLREMRSWGMKPQIELKTLPSALDEKFVNTILKYYTLSELDSIVSADRELMKRLYSKYGLPLVTPIEDVVNWENLGIYSKTATITFDSPTISTDTISARLKGYDIAIKGSTNVTNIQWLWNDVLLNYGVQQALADAFAPNVMGGTNLQDIKANANWDNVTLSSVTVTDEVALLTSSGYIQSPSITVDSFGGIKGSAMLQGKFTLAIRRGGANVETHTIDTLGACKRVFISRLIKSTGSYDVRITSTESNSKVYDFDLKVNQFVK